MQLLWSQDDCCKLLHFSSWTFFYHIRPLFHPAFTQRGGKKGTKKVLWTTDQVIAMMHHYYRIDDRAHAEIVRRVEEWTRPTSLTIIEDKPVKKQLKRKK